MCVLSVFFKATNMTSDGKKGVIFLEEALSPCFGSQTHLSFPTPQGASVFSRFLAEDWYPSAPTKPVMIIEPCLLCPGTQPWNVLHPITGPSPIVTYCQGCRKWMSPNLAEPSNFRWIGGSRLLERVNKPPNRFLR